MASMPRTHLRTLVAEEKPERVEDSPKINTIIMAMTVTPNAIRTMERKGSRWSIMTGTRPVRMDGNIADLDKFPIAAILRRVHIEDFVPGPVLLCLSTGARDLDCFEQMPRLPMPTVGYEFDGTFVERFRKSIELNRSVHDGAIILRRSSHTHPYRVTGWSQRLVAKSGPNEKPVMNRGSAYNSCLATSYCEGVDGVFLLSGASIYHFVGGIESAAFEL